MAAFNFTYKNLAPFPRLPLLLVFNLALPLIPSFLLFLPGLYYCFPITVSLTAYKAN